MDAQHVEQSKQYPCSTIRSPPHTTHRSPFNISPDAALVPYRSAPLPLKVDGCSVGAVMGYSEQKTLLLLTSEEEISVFLNVSFLQGGQHTGTTGDGSTLWQHVSMDSKCCSRQQQAGVDRQRQKASPWQQTKPVVPLCHVHASHKRAKGRNPSRADCSSTSAAT